MGCGAVDAGLLEGLVPKVADGALVIGLAGFGVGEDVDAFDGDRSSGIGFGGVSQGDQKGVELVGDGDGLKALFGFGIVEVDPVAIGFLENFGPGKDTGFIQGAESGFDEKLPEGAPGRSRFGFEDLVEGLLRKRWALGFLLEFGDVGEGGGVIADHPFLLGGLEGGSEGGPNGRDGAGESIVGQFLKESFDMAIGDLFDRQVPEFRLDV